MIAIDIGNTKTAIGVFDQGELQHLWRISTNPNRTADEYLITLEQLFSSEKKKLHIDDGIIVSSVVPKVSHQLLGLSEKADIHFVSHTTPTSFVIKLEEPGTLGPDRIATLEGAIQSYGYPIIVVDVGTAITVSVINQDREFIGGTISPGIGISMEALFTKAARLTQIEVSSPKEVVGKTTEDALASGIHHGFASLLDGLILRIQNELKHTDIKVVGCGGAIGSISTFMKTPIQTDVSLTMKGLASLHRNVKENL